MLRLRINRPEIQPEVKENFRQYGFFYILIVMVSWYHTGDSTTNWFIVLNAYALLSAVFPFVVWLLTAYKEFLVLSIVAALRILSNISDLYYIDKYDSELLFIKTVLTLYALVLMLFRIEVVKVFFYDLLDTLKIQSDRIIYLLKPWLKILFNIKWILALSVKIEKLLKIKNSKGDK